jgi:hypothetical protein
MSRLAELCHAYALGRSTLTQTEQDVREHLRMNGPTVDELRDMMALALISELVPADTGGLSASNLHSLGEVIGWRAYWMVEGVLSGRAKVQEARNRGRGGAMVRSGGPAADGIPAGDPGA